MKIDLIRRTLLGGALAATSLGAALLPASSASAGAG